MSDTKKCKLGKKCPDYELAVSALNDLQEKVNAKYWEGIAKDNAELTGNGPGVPGEAGERQKRGGGTATRTDASASGRRWSGPALSLSGRCVHGPRRKDKRL